MKKIFFSHPDIILASIAVVLLALLISFFSWAINDVVLQVHQAVVDVPISSQQGFNLQAAGELNLRGVAITTVASTTSTPATTTVVTTASTTATTTISTSTAH